LVKVAVFIRIKLRECFLSLSCVKYIVWDELSLDSDADKERLGRLNHEEKVNLAIDMSDAVVRICAEGIRAQFPGISDRELIEKLRERLEWSKRWRRRGV
jgi:hypothetical protein